MAVAALAAMLGCAALAARPAVSHARLRAATGGDVVGHRTGAATAAGRTSGVRQAAASSRRRREVVQIAADLAAELRAGAGWRQALVSAGADGDELVMALRAATDPDSALARLGQLDGAEGLLAIAAAGRLASDLGAPAAALADDIAAALRADELARRTVDVELAAAVATARLLALLPVVGLLLGAALGAAPLEVLVGTPAGRGCAAGAAVLEALGIGWCRAIRRRAEP